MDTDIFIKKGKSLSYNNIVKSIPTNSYKSEQKELLKKGLKEWRWRFIKLDRHMKVEISCNEINKHRLYLLDNGDWVKRKISDIYDDFVVKQYYYYSRKD